MGRKRIKIEIQYSYQTMLLTTRNERIRRMLQIAGTGNGERGTGNGERGTGNGERGTANGERGTGNGKRGTGNGERGTGNGERGTGNGERGTGNGEWGTGNGERKRRNDGPKEDKSRNSVFLPEDVVNDMKRTNPQDVTNTGNGQRATSNGKGGRETGTGNGERKMENEERGTGNRSLGTSVPA